MEPAKTEKIFKVRAYYTSELGTLYNPQLCIQAATRQLRRWIDYNPHLKEELIALGYISGQRCFTPKQVACLVEYLGEP